MTHMYNQGVPGKVIANKSGHRSLDGLRAYEHPCSDIDKAAGLIIADPTRCFEDVRRKLETLEEPSPTIEKQEHREEPSPTIPKQEPCEEPSPTIPKQEPREEPSPTISTEQVPGFSGLNNCTITFNITYGKKD